VIFLGDVFCALDLVLKLSGGKADLVKSEAHLFYYRKAELLWNDIEKNPFYNDS